LQHESKSSETGEIEEKIILPLKSVEADNMHQLKTHELSPDKSPAI